MKSFPVAALLIFASALPAAFAADDSAAPTQTIATSHASSKTRAQVQAELAAARAPGGELSMNPNQPLYPEEFSMGGFAVPIESFDAARERSRHATSSGN
jgi:hypothetical protein